jgi:hypothetical protein
LTIYFNSTISLKISSKNCPIWNCFWENCQVFEKIVKFLRKLSNLWENLKNLWENCLKLDNLLKNSINFKFDNLIKMLREIVVFKINCQIFEKNGINFKKKLNNFW